MTDRHHTLDERGRTLRQRVRRLTGRESDAELGDLERQIADYKTRRANRADIERAATWTGSTVAMMKQELAEADPQQPSPCRLCGRLTGGAGGGWAWHAGWRWCEHCAPCLTAENPYAAAWSLALGRDVSDRQARALTERLGSPAYGTGRQADGPAQTEPFAHLTATLREQAADVLYRAAWEGQPRPNSLGTGCAWCGVARSTSWTASGIRHADGSDAALCAGCSPSWLASGQSTHPDTWAAFLVAACTGTEPMMGMEAYGLQAYCHTPGEHTGTDEPWAYLGDDRRRLRWAVVKAYPSQATRQEREQMARVAKVRADAEPPPPPTPLVRLPPA
jgi:hypothetical protein